jgi:tripartite ATP-independent transporter DctP family solute receptor
MHRPARDLSTLIGDKKGGVHVMRKLLPALLLGAALALGAQAQAAEITVKIAHGASVKHPFNKLVELFKEAVERKTGGRVEVQIFGNRQLGGDVDVLKGARAGTIDGAFASSVLFPWIVKSQSFDALQLPFLVSSYENLATLMSSEIGMKMLATLDKIGLKGLSFGAGGQRNFLSTKGPVTRLADFKGLKTRIVPAKLHKAMWVAVGTNPTPVKYGEIYTALKTKLIDAVEINISSVESENLWENAKYLSRTGHYFWPGVLVFNKARFEALPKDVQQAMIEAGREIIAPQVAYTKAQEIEATARLKAKGVKFYDFKDLAAMRELMVPIVKRWEATDPLIADYVAAARKLEKGM